MDPVPQREKVEVYDENGVIHDLEFRNADVKEGMDWQENREYRNTSRNRYREGILRQMFKMKTVTNDDSRIFFKSTEKNLEQSFSTDPALSFTDTDLQVQSGVPGTSDTVPSVADTAPTATEDDELSFLNLARLSPSKPFRKANCLIDGQP